MPRLQGASLGLVSRTTQERNFKGEALESGSGEVDVSPECWEGLLGLTQHVRARRKLRELAHSRILRKCGSKEVMRSQEPIIREPRPPMSGPP